MKQRVFNKIDNSSHLLWSKWHFLSELKKKKRKSVFANGTGKGHFRRNLYRCFYLYFSVAQLGKKKRSELERALNVHVMYVFAMTIYF